MQVHLVFPWVETGDFFKYVINDSDLERVFNDLGVLVDSRMTFANQIHSIVSKSARMLGFI
jgi:hypothetical protein